MNIKYEERACKECLKIYKAHPRSSFCSNKCKKKNGHKLLNITPEYRLRKLLQMAKHRAFVKNLPFNLDLDYMLKLWNEADGKCAILKIPLELEKSDVGKVHPYAPSFDRIVPSLGYTKGNVRIIAYQLNVALSEWGLSQFEELVKHFINNTDLGALNGKQSGIAHC